MGLSSLVLRSPVFDLPDKRRRASLLAAVPQDLTPRILRNHDPMFPVLIETWRRDGKLQVHLVNYCEQPQVVELIFAVPVQARVVSPDCADVIQCSGQTLEIWVDVYSIVLVDAVGG
ncbi:MAG: hypothetical protein IH586_12135, partial [Anaerolineaceae bacterium]|nr:hypothetical protein [Anaerolineaceae bacterium]